MVTQGQEPTPIAGEFGDSAAPQGATWELAPGDSGDAGVETPPAEETVAAAPAAEEQAPPDGGGPDEAVSTPEVTVPFSVPADLLLPDPQPQSGLSEAERQDYQRLLQRQAEFDQAQSQRAQDERIRGIQAEFERRGYDFDTAQAMAAAYREGMGQTEQELRQIQQQTVVQQAKQRAAQHYGEQYGVNPEHLLPFNSPQEMERYAVLAQGYAKLQKDFNDRIGALERNRVPDQQYDQGAGGDQGITAENVDAMYLQGKISPERYRDFLENGRFR